MSHIHGSLLQVSIVIYCYILLYCYILQINRLTIPEVLVFTELILNTETRTEIKKGSQHEGLLVLSQSQRMIHPTPARPMFVSVSRSPICTAAEIIFTKSITKCSFVNKKTRSKTTHTEKCKYILSKENIIAHQKYDSQMTSIIIVLLFYCCMISLLYSYIVNNDLVWKVFFKHSVVTTLK